MSGDLLVNVLQTTIGGLTIGSIYAVVALGFVLTLNVTGVTNLAQGDFLTIGALIMISLTAGLKLPIAVAFVITVLVVTVIGILMERLAIRPSRYFPHVVAVLITLGVAITLEGGALIIWGASPYSVPSFSGEEPISFLGAFIASQTIWVLTTMLIIALFLWFLFERLMIGKAMRACAENPSMASLTGINVVAMAALSFALAGAMGGLVGMVVAPITFVTYNAGIMVGLKGFVVAVLGGWGSYVGAIVGGLVLGLLESFGAGYISSEYKDTIAFVVLLLVLFIRPSGLLGKQES